MSPERVTARRSRTVPEKIATYMVTMCDGASRVSVVGLVEYQVGEFAVSPLSFNWSVEQEVSGVPRRYQSDNYYHNMNDISNQYECKMQIRL
jgi:hypothetical protein